jgi:MFS family permease
MHREAWTLAASGIAAFAGGSVSVLPPLVIQYVAPNQLRGRLMALNLLPTNLVGMTLGPFLVAVLSEHLFSGRFALGYAIATVALLVAPSSVYCFVKARAGYVRAFEGALP